MLYPIQFSITPCHKDAFVCVWVLLRGLPQRYVPQSPGSLVVGVVDCALQPRSQGFSLFNWDGCAHWNRCLLFLEIKFCWQTKRRLKDRFNEHQRPVDKPTPSSRPTAVSDHFLTENHSPADMELIPLEIMHSSRDAIRKAREAYLIDRGQTLEPKGINKREEM